MATVEQVIIQFQDQASAGANAAAQALERAATAAERFGAATDTTEQTIRRAGPTMEAIAAKTDGAAAAASRLEAANRRYEASVAAVVAAQQKGDISAAQAAQTLQRLATARDADAAAAEAYGQKIEARFAPAAKATDALTVSTGSAAFAMRQLGVQAVQTASSIASGQPIITTLVQQGHQVADVALSTGTGFSIMGQAIKAAFSALVSPIGLAVSAAAVLGTLGAAAESSARQMATLQNELRATRDDYVSLATEVTAAAKAIAATTSIGTADARVAAQAIASAPNFAGTQAQLQELVKTAGDLALVMGITVPAAAKLLAAGLQDPGAEAQKLADQHFPGMSQALAYSIKLMADGGDKAGAFARELKVMQDGTQGASENLTPLQASLKNLAEAFTKTGQDGRSLADVLGSAITGAAALAINAIAGVVKGIESLRQSAPGLGGQPNTPQGAAALTPDATGRPVLTSSAGALGLMQVLPDVAKALGYNPNFQDQNILAGLTVIQQLSQQFGGSQSAIAGAYNRGPSGYRANPAAASDYIAKVASANVGQLPADVASQIEYWGQVLGLPPDLIALGQRIAVVESGGKQYGTAAAAVASNPGISGAGIAALAGVGIGGIPASVPGQNQQASIDAAFKAYLSSNALSVQQAANASQQSVLRAGISAAVSQGDVDTVNKLTEALAKARGEETDLITEQQKLARSAVDATAALSAQSGFARDMAAIDQQFAEASRKSGQAIDQQALALAKVAEQVKLSTEFTDAIQATDLATAAQVRINNAYDGTVTSISHAQNAETAYAQARKDYQEGQDGFTEAVTRYTAALDRSSAAVQQFQQEQASVSALAGAFSQAFDTIGNAITQAFVQGQGAAVNWGNVLKSVISQVIQQVAKLAIINPILNSLFGQNNGTLGTAIGVLSGSGGSSAGGLGISDIVSGVGTASSISGAFGGPTLLSSLGITGPGGLLSNLGLTGSGGVFSGIGGGISSFLGTGSGIGADGAASTYLASLGINPGAGLGGASIGSLLGGAGLGFGAGSLLNSLVGGHQLGGTVGSGLGSIAGTVIGSIFGGPLLGGLAGGLLGGGLGGLIGPGKANPYTSEQITVDANGKLALGRTAAQITDNTQEIAQAQSDINAINDYLSSVGLTIKNARNAASGFASEGSIFQVGSGGPAAATDLTKVSSVAGGFSLLNFGSDDAKLNSLVQGKTFSSLTDLQNAVTQYQQAQTAIIQFIGTTAPPLKAFGTTAGALNDQIDALNKQYGEAIETAKTLAASQYATANQTADLTQQENDLTEARNRAVKAANDNAAQALLTTNAGLTARFDAASGASSLQVALETFDAQAQQQRDALSASLVSTYGDTIKSTQSYADEMAFLERTLGAERLQIIKQSDSQILAATQAQAAAIKQIQVGNESVTGRYLTAAAAISGSQADALKAALYNFDSQAQQQRDALDTQLYQLFGEGSRTLAIYASEMTQLDQTLAEERLAIQKQYGDQSVAQATTTEQSVQQAQQGALSLVTSISDYIRKISFGADSPLSPLDQYAQASNQFNAVAGAAAAGDFGSAQSLTSYADTFLQASRAVNGSGLAYAQDFQKVTDALRTIASMTPDQLTTASMTQISQTQTAQITDGLGDLGGKLDALLTALRQMATRPASVAA